MSASLVFLGTNIRSGIIHRPVSQLKKIVKEKFEFDRVHVERTVNQLFKEIGRWRAEGKLNEGQEQRLQKTVHKYALRYQIQKTTLIFQKFISDLARFRQTLRSNLYYQAGKLFCDLQEGEITTLHHEIGLIGKLIKQDVDVRSPFYEQLQKMQIKITDKGELRSLMIEALGVDCLVAEGDPVIEKGVSLIEAARLIEQHKDIKRRFEEVRSGLYQQNPKAREGLRELQELQRLHKRLEQAYKILELMDVPFIELGTDIFIEILRCEAILDRDAAKAKKPEPVQAAPAPIEKVKKNCLFRFWDWLSSLFSCFFNRA